ncbi:trafficking protein particle complex subunit 8 homolog l(3)76BDm isoform X2 [Tachypleus tridentatus]|uniref:trafficking protein particle complex subunit 8 homolog l(3)76BDm isoform X2 n=1 Tax=Tachypleus tridentatus TaxID=6853 RepID=UPI003FD42882
MSSFKHTAQELIQYVFAPKIAVVSSSGAEAICQKNNLTFVQLVRPFCTLKNEATIRDPSNFSFTLKHFHVCMRDIWWQPPQPALAKKLLNDAVTSSPIPDDASKTTMIVGSYELNIHTSTPWFEAYRDVFFQANYPSEHEFSQHYVACIYVVSSQHTSPLEEFQRLHHEQQQHFQRSAQQAKWFLPQIVKYYVLLHDLVEGDLSVAESAFHSIKMTYGAQFCYLLQINSHQDIPISGINDTQKTSTLPDSWKQFLHQTVEKPPTQGKDVEIPSALTDGTFNNFVEVGQEAQLHVDYNGETEKPVNDILMSHPLSEESDSSPVSQTPLDSMTSSWSSQTSAKWSAASQPHGMCLSVSDIDNIKNFVQEFCLQALMPFAERQIRQLSEQVANRKGLHRSLFSATKKWFGSSKPGLQGVTPASNSVVYSQDAPELQVRRLGDLAFMFRLYDLSYQAYHNAKREFNSDQAWLYCAGAMEMAALSVFMIGNLSQRQYPFHYMESAISMYLNTCKMVHLATRATLLSTDCLRAMGMYSDAALQFIRMTSEDSDLRSALLLEQAAHCFLKIKLPMVRKYAFHIILAGHRFSKAGQRRHSLRSYKDALQVYKDRGWSLAQDHIYFTVGRQSQNLKHLEDSCSAFRALLADKSQQPVAQQTAFLREYLFVQKFLTQSTDVNSLPLLPLPYIDCQSTKVLFDEPLSVPCDGSDLVQSRGFDDDHDSELWRKLEEMLIIKARGSLPVLHRPQVCCMSNKTDNSNRPTAVVGVLHSTYHVTHQKLYLERTTILLYVKNPLRVPILLSNLYLLWTFIPVKECNQHVVEHINNDQNTGKNLDLESLIKTEILPELTLQSEEETSVQLSVTPYVVGELHITGLSYGLGLQKEPNDTKSASVLVQGKQPLRVRGMRLNNTKTEKLKKIYAPDYRFHMVIVPPMPRLQIKFTGFPKSLLCGEVIKLTVHLKNVGQQALRQLFVASTTPELFSFGTLDHEEDSPSDWQVYHQTTNQSMHSGPVIAEWPNIERVSHLPLTDECLQPGQDISLPFWVRGSDQPGEQKLHFLFYYEPSETAFKLKHRLLQHTVHFTLKPSVHVETMALRSGVVPSDTRSNQDSVNSLIINLKVQNISQIPYSEGATVTVLQVAGVSQDWSVAALSDQQKQGPMTVKPEESCHLSLRAVPCASRNTVSSPQAVMLSQVPFGRMEIDSSATPCSDFCWRSQLKLPSLSEDGLITDKTHSFPDFLQDVKFGENNLSQEVKASQKVGILVTVVWKAEVQHEDSTQVIMGQHHLLVENVNTLVSTVPKQQFQISEPMNAVSLFSDSNETDIVGIEQLVKWTLQHPFCVEHDFQSKRLLIVPVLFIAHNCSLSPVDVEVDLSSYRNSDRVTVSTPSSDIPVELTAFSWVSQTRYTISLEPGTTTQIYMKACFNSCGTYNLSCLQVTASSCFSPSGYLQECLAPSLIVITEAQPH